MQITCISQLSLTVESKHVCESTETTLGLGVINYVVMRPLTTTLAFITEVGVIGASWSRFDTHELESRLVSLESSRYTRAKKKLAFKRAFQM